ncbi:MAG TPA: glycosyltransferase family 2 protein [Thermoanaerobaculia bacterium]|nr:glycosyltransferase family 2 protein [Thermoanaerobaculia bacterium]
MTVDFVMPVRNEGANIARALRELYEKVPIAKRVLMVYDSEDDDTLPVVRSLTFPGLTLVRNTRGRGVLNAIRAGFDAAEAELVIVTMADLSDDLAIVPEMVRLAEDGADIVCASRYMRGGRQIGGPWLKGMLSRLAGLSLRLLVRFPTHDATNAFRAYRLSVVRRFPIESTGGFEYSLELTAKAHAAGLRVVEVPATWNDRIAGQTAFQLWKWLPRYLRWYGYALTHRPKPTSRKSR